VGRERAGRRKDLLVHAADDLASASRAAGPHGHGPAGADVRGQSWTTMVRSEGLIVRPSAS
jgi:hypothetical protein